MKKLLTFGLVTALSLSTVAEAKRGGGFRMSKPSTTQSQKRTQDADFNNTPPVQQPMNGATQVRQGSSINNFVTGAAAGYLLSDVLSPTEAQAKENTNVQGGSSAKSLENQSVPVFKLVDPMDHNVIERTANYSRYCLGGVQYMVSGSKAILLVDSQNQPQRCEIVQ